MNLLTILAAAAEEGTNTYDASVAMWAAISAVIVALITTAGGIITLFVQNRKQKATDKKVDFIKESAETAASESSEAKKRMIQLQAELKTNHNKRAGEHIEASHDIVEIVRSIAAKQDEEASTRQEVVNTLGMVVREVVKVKDTVHAVKDEVHEVKDRVNVLEERALTNLGAIAEGNTVRVEELESLDTIQETLNGKSVRYCGRKMHGKQCTLPHRPERP